MRPIDDHVSTDDMSVFGAQLREIREANGFTYDDVADETHVRPGILEAIENGQIDGIAAPVYMRGFIRTYCEFLAADDLWKKYSVRLQILSSPKNDEISDSPDAKQIDIPADHSVRRGSPIGLIYLVLVISLIGSAFLLWRQLESPAPEDDGFFLKNELPVSAAPVSKDEGPEVVLSAVSVDAAPSIDVKVTDAPPEASPDLPAALPISADDRMLVINVNEPTRLIVSQNGAVLTRRNLERGEMRTYDVIDATPVSMSVGRAVEITWAGVKYAPAGNDSGPLALVFYPDGSVTLTDGHSDHFRKE